MHPNEPKDGCIDDANDNCWMDASMTQMMPQHGWDGRVDDGITAEVWWDGCTMMQMMPPDAMQGVTADMVQMVPPDAVMGMSAQMVEMMPRSNGWCESRDDGENATRSLCKVWILK